MCILFDYSARTEHTWERLKSTSHRPLQLKSPNLPPAHLILPLILPLPLQISRRSFSLSLSLSLYLSLSFFLSLSLSLSFSFSLSLSLYLNHRNLWFRYGQYGFETSFERWPLGHSDHSPDYARQGKKNYRYQLIIIYTWFCSICKTFPEKLLLKVIRILIYNYDFYILYLEIVIFYACFSYIEVIYIRVKWIKWN